MRPTPLLTGLVSMALLVLGLVALLPDCASACTCAEMLGGQQERAVRALEQATAVFAGQVVNIRKGEPAGAWQPATLAVSFRVSEVWKGPEQQTLQVSTASQGPACGYRFSEGREYLVYAMGRGMKVNAYGETKPLSEVRADLEVLGDGAAVGNGGSTVLSDTSGGFPPLGVIGMMGLAVAAVSWVLLMRLVPGPARPSHNFAERSFRNCPKSDSSNAPSVNLAGLRRTR
jgi:hypothetical protein